MSDMILRCPDSECWTTYDASEDADAAFGEMVKHYRYNMRHNDGKTFEDAATAVSVTNSNLRAVQ